MHKNNTLLKTIIATQKQNNHKRQVMYAKNLLTYTGSERVQL